MLNQQEQLGRVTYSRSLLLVKSYVCLSVSYYLEVFIRLDPNSFHVEPDPIFIWKTAIFNHLKLLKDSVFFSESVFRSSKGTECGSGSATLTSTFLINSS